MIISLNLLDSILIKFLKHYLYPFRIKMPYPLQWGAPTFDAGHAFGMMAAVIVSLIEVNSNLQNQLIF